MIVEKTNSGNVQNHFEFHSSQTFRVFFQEVQVRHLTKASYTIKRELCSWKTWFLFEKKHSKKKPRATINTFIRVQKK